jgi:hypothetical protein
MISGTTAWSRFSVSVDLALVASIVFTYASRGGDILLQKRYPDHAEYREGRIWLPLSQADTTKLRSGGEQVLVELQFNFSSGAVGKSRPKVVCVDDTLATEYVDGSFPDESQYEDGAIDVFVDDVVVVHTGSGGMPYEIGYGLNVENNTLSAEVGKSSFIEIPNTKVQEIFKKVMEG